MLSQAQKIAVRRHLGVPFAGTAQAGRLYGWRFTWYNEDLEYRMNNMQAPEEQLLIGNSLGSWKIYGLLEVGNTLSFTINDGVINKTITYTVQESDFAPPPNPVNPADSSPLYSVALNSAIALNNVLAGYGYQATGVMPADLFSPAYLPPYYSEVVISGPGQNLFALGGTATGQIVFLVEQQGTASPVVATFTNASTGVQTTCYGYIAVCNYLAMGVAQAGLSLWLTQASGAGGSGVGFRPTEMTVRDQQYAYYCMQLESCLGGPEYLNKFGGGSSGGAVA